MKYVRYKGLEYPYSSSIATVRNTTQDLKREKIYKVEKTIEKGKRKLYRLSGIVGEYPIELFDVFV